MQEYEAEQTDETSIKDYWIYIAVAVIALLIFVLFRGRWGQLSWDKATATSMLLILGLWIYKSTWNTFLNMSPKIIYNYGHATTDGEIIPAGNYVIMRFAVKTLESLGMYWKLPGAAIVPADGWSKHGPSIALLARMEKVELDEIPRDPRSVIIKKKIPGPYILGFADEEQYKEVLKDPKAEDPAKRKISVSHLITEIKELNKENSFLRRIVSRYMRDVEDMKEWAERMAKGERLTESLKSLILERESEKK